MESQKNSGGIWMLVGLVALLAAPVIIGHFAMAPADTTSLAALAPAAN